MCRVRPYFANQANPGIIMTSRMKQQHVNVLTHRAIAAGHTQASAAIVHPDIHSDPTADYRNLGLLQLLKKASRRRGGGSLPPTTTAAQHSLSYGQAGQDANSLGRAQSSLHSYAGTYCSPIACFWLSNMTASYADKLDSLCLYVAVASVPLISQA